MTDLEGPDPQSTDPEAKSSPSLVPSAFNILRDVEVEVAIEIGRRRMRIADVLRLGPGQTIELSKAVGEPIDVYVNGQLLARGEAVVVNERYGVPITELLGPAGRQ